MSKLSALRSTARHSAKVFRPASMKASRGAVEGTSDRVCYEHQHGWNLMGQSSV
jgi:hypothetical protein